MAAPIGRRITRSLAKTLAESPSAASPAAAHGDAPVSARNGGGAHHTGGMIRCVCNDFLRSLNEVLLECVKCHNWCHPGCLGFDSVDAKDQIGKFVCPFCTGDFKKRKRAVDKKSRIPTVRLTEVEDKVPRNAVVYRRLLEQLRRVALVQHCTIIDIPSPSELTDDLIAQCMECCEGAIQDATFSRSYPEYCLKETQTQPHAYLQGSLLKDTRTGKIVALALTNGMDQYGNLKSTVYGHKQTVEGRNLKDDDMSPRAVMLRSLFTQDVSDCVHFTLIATHHDYRGKGLAKIVMQAEMLKWLLRGRSRSFLNMALQKHTDSKNKLVCSVSPASQRLYQLFGFLEVVPKYEADGSLKWTAKEADLGRAMANVDMDATVHNVMKRLETSAAEAAAKDSAAPAASTTGKRGRSPLKLSLKKGK